MCVCVCVWQDGFSPRSALWYLCYTGAPPLQPRRYDPAKRGVFLSNTCCNVVTIHFLQALNVVYCRCSAHSCFYVITNTIGSRAFDLCHSRRHHICETAAYSWNKTSELQYVYLCSKTELYTIYWTTVAFDCVHFRFRLWLWVLHGIFC